MNAAAAPLLNDTPKRICLDRLVPPYTDKKKTLGWLIVSSCDGWYQIPGKQRKDQGGGGVRARGMPAFVPA